MQVNRMLQGRKCRYNIQVRRWRGMTYVICNIAGRGILVGIAIVRQSEIDGLVVINGHNVIISENLLGWDHPGQYLHEDWYWRPKERAIAHGPNCPVETQRYRDLPSWKACSARLFEIVTIGLCSKTQNSDECPYRRRIGQGLHMCSTRYS